MLLSILVPVFNWNITLLLNCLVNEIIEHELSDRIEIILADDYSSDQDIKNINRGIISRAKPLINLQYIELEANIGRAGVRNILVEKSTGQFLLLLDADVLPDNINFLQEYLRYVQEKDVDVICGGISYNIRIMHEPRYDFHVYLSKKNDVKFAQEKNIIPWKYLFTSNVMVKKLCFIDTPFDTRFIDYGYEDIEWGIRLAKNYTVLHIDNTVSHLGLITKACLYDRMKNSIKNYFLIANLHPDFFLNGSIYRFIRILKGINLWTLKFCAKILQITFFTSISKTLSYLAFQMSKAVLLTLEFKIYYREKK